MTPETYIDQHFGPGETRKRKEKAKREAVLAIDNALRDLSELACFNAPTPNPDGCRTCRVIANVKAAKIFLSK